MQFIFPQKDSLEKASGLLAALAVSVVLYGLSTLTNAVLQGIGRVNTPVIHAAVALVIQMAALIAMLLYTDLNLYALVCANIIYSLVVCILNQISVRKHLKYKQEMMKTFVKPLVSAVVPWSVSDPAGEPDRASDRHRAGRLCLLCDDPFYRRCE